MRFVLQFPLLLLTWLAVCTTSEDASGGTVQKIQSDGGTLLIRTSDEDPDLDRLGTHTQNNVFKATLELPEQRIRKVVVKFFTEFRDNERKNKAARDKEAAINELLIGVANVAQCDVVRRSGQTFCNKGEHETEIGSKQVTLYFLVFVHYEYGSLDDYFMRANPPALSPLSLMLDILEGLAALKRRGIAHFDVKASNIFVHDSHRALLGDFGSAYTFELTTTSTADGSPLLDESYSYISGPLTTKGYRAPELLLPEYSPSISPSLRAVFKSHSEQAWESSIFQSVFPQSSLAKERTNVMLSIRFKPARVMKEDPEADSKDNGESQEPTPTSPLRAKLQQLIADTRREYEQNPEKFRCVTRARSPFWAADMWSVGVVFMRLLARCSTAFQGGYPFGKQWNANGDDSYGLVLLYYGAQSKDAALASLSDILDAMNASWSSMLSAEGRREVLDLLHSMFAWATFQRITPKKAFTKLAHIASSQVIDQNALTEQTTTPSHTSSLTSVAVPGLVSAAPVEPTPARTESCVCQPGSTDTALCGQAKATQDPVSSNGKARV